MFDKRMIDGRGNWLFGVIGLVAAATMALGALAPTALAGEVEPLLESCDSGNECVWNSPNYQGTRVEVNCIGGIHNVGTEWSAKNRCANKRVWLIWAEGEEIHYKVCMNPGGDRPEPGRFNNIEVGTEGSRC